MTESSAARPVIVGHDSSPNSAKAVAWAAGAAERLGRPLVVISARENDSAPARSHEGVEAARALKPHLEVTGEDPVGSGSGVMVRAGERAEMIVMGSRGRGRLSSALLGTVSMTTAQHAGCPVVIIHGEDVDDRAPQRIIVGADGSPSSTAALDFALSLAGPGSTVRLVLAWSTMAEDSTDPVPAVGQALLEQTLAGRSKDGVTIDLEARPGAPRDVLVHLSEQADLLVVGRRGREGFRGLNLGSVAQHALFGAKCPVAVVTARQE